MLVHILTMIYHSYFIFHSIKESNINATVRTTFLVKVVKGMYHFKFLNDFCQFMTCEFRGDNRWDIKTRLGILSYKHFLMICIQLVQSHLFFSEYHHWFLWLYVSIASYVCLLSFYYFLTVKDLLLEPTTEESLLCIYKSLFNNHFTKTIIILFTIILSTIGHIALE